MKKLMILVAALALVATSALTAAAADWNFFGSSRVSTFITDIDTIDTAGGFDSKSYGQALQGNSRIGAKVKVSDELTGGFEYGTGVNVRLLYGEWNFGAGSFLVGQHYTPLNFFYSNQVYGADNDMLGQGGVYSGRKPMLRLTFGDFEVAFISPNTRNIGGTPANYYSEADMPSVEAKYVLKMDNVSVAMAGGYNTYELTNGSTSYDVDSYVLALRGRVGFGAAYLAGNIYTGQNAGHLIAIDVGGDNMWNDGFAEISGNRVLDNDAFGYILLAGYQINDMFTLEAGYGYVETELDTASTEDEACVYYLQSTVNLAPGVFFVPEIGRFDGHEAGQRETTYYGAKWQINF